MTEPPTPNLPTVFVRGVRTTTSAHDQAVAEKHADAEKRRAEEDKTRAAARDLGGHLREMKLGGKSEYPMIVLAVEDPRDKTAYEWLVCELIEQQPLAGEAASQSVVFVLNMICPSCVFKHGIHPEEAQIKIHEEHKKMVFRPGLYPKWHKDSGGVWVNPQDVSDVYMLAGTVDVPEWCTCPTCNFRFQIEDSVLKPYSHWRAR